MICQLSTSKLHKPVRVLCQILCLTVLLSSLFTSFHLVNGFYYGSDSIHSQTDNNETQFDCYPLHTNEKYISRTVFPDQLLTGCQRRLPLRFPMPPVLLLLSACLYHLLLCMQKRKNFLYAPERDDNLYTIRYIHDQNGETYHSFLF